MADSTLSLEYVGLMNAVSYFLYGKADYTDLTEAQQGIADKAVNIGYRQFLYPPAIEGLPSGFEWSFLQSVTTITTTEDDEDQDMPDDFGRLIGSGFTYGANTQVLSVLADIGEGKIRKLRQQSDESGRPRVAAIRIKAGDGLEGQRREVMWYPKPDDVYTLYYKYEALVNALTTEAPYPLGAMKHADTLRISCLAAADLLVNDKRSIHWENFQRAVIASAKRDKREGAKFFGNVGCKGEYDNNSTGSLLNYTLTVYGEVIEG